ncbi:MAG: acyltransferase family protein [Brachybacterium tyrofermentans]
MSGALKAQPGARPERGDDPAGRARPASTASAPPRRRVEIIDYLRLIAAFSVVAFHYLYNGIENGKLSSLEHEPIAQIAQYGYLGVNLFFMISGYVILASVTGKSAHQFAVGRALRLYPAFWVALLITTAFSLVIGGHGMGISVPEFLANLTMVPELLDQPLVDGVYWTLLYEIQFYVLVFLLVLFRQGHRLEMLMPAWAILMLYLTVAAPEMTSSAPYLGGYFVWFAAGAIIASIAESGWSAYKAVGLLAAYLPISHFELSLLTGLKTVVFLVPLVVLIPAVRQLRLPGSKTAGALTYPLYLLHAHIGYMLLSTFATEQNKWVVYPVVVLLVVALAYALHVTVERHPVSRRFSAWAFHGTLGRAVDVLQAVVDRFQPAQTLESPEPAAQGAEPAGQGAETAGQGAELAPLGKG